MSSTGVTAAVARLPTAVGDDGAIWTCAGAGLDEVDGRLGKNSGGCCVV